jgi:uncharacterized protein YbaR (Trm112 family)
MKYQFSEFCACPVCHNDVHQQDNRLICSTCQRSYPIENGIPILLPVYENSVQQQYHQNYETIAEAFIETNKSIADNVAGRHEVLLDFIGRKHIGKRVLDIGSSHALYLDKVDADFKVALDIAATYLRLIPHSTGIVPIQGDAENLPLKKGFFDIIIIADILEHVLNPEELVECVKNVCHENTRIFVHIPWEEDLTPYLNSRYKFSHLRSFDTFYFTNLWREFSVLKWKDTFPALAKSPIIFTLEKKLPRFIYNALVWAYYRVPNVAVKESEWRQKRYAELPKGEKWLLLFYKPVFRMFEMCPRRDMQLWRLYIKPIAKRFRRLFNISSLKG